MLGVLTMTQTMAFSLSLPIWSMLLPSRGARGLLTAAITMWMCSTSMVPFNPSLQAQCVLRLTTGVALSGVVPITQAVIAGTVVETERGWAFGVLGAVKTAATSVVTYYVMRMGDEWAICYVVIALSSFLVLALVRTQLPARFGKSKAPEGSQEWSANALVHQAVRTVCKVIRIPTFVLLLLQGVFGGAPWQNFGFLSVFYLSLGFSSERAGVIMALGSFGGFFGSLLGGWLGDVAVRRSPLHGRLFVAQLSVLGGMPLWAWMLNPGVAGHGLRSALAAIFTFYLVATWAGVAANRPICAELVSDPGERAQIVSVWLLVEGFTNALLGAPLVGRLTMLFGYRLQKCGRCGI
jgi:MFS family permease